MCSSQCMCAHLYACVRVGVRAYMCSCLCICDVCHAPAGMKEQRCWFLFNFQDSMMWQSGSEKCSLTSVRVLSTKILLWVTVIGFYAVEKDMLMFLVMIFNVYAPTSRDGGIIIIIYLALCSRFFWLGIRLSIW